MASLPGAQPSEDAPASGGGGARAGQRRRREADSVAHSERGQSEGSGEDLLGENMADDYREM